MRPLDFYECGNVCVCVYNRWHNHCRSLAEMVLSHARKSQVNMTCTVPSERPQSATE